LDECPLNNYKHSGRITLFGVTAAAVAGLAAGFPLAFIYAWGLIRISDQHLSGIATLAYGALIGAIVWLVARSGKVRNVQIVGFLAVCAATASFYWSWAFWVSDIFNNIGPERLNIIGQEELNAFALMQQPHELWELIKLINQDGTWGTMAGHATKGVELWILWVCEAVAVVGTAALTAVTGLQAQPFCEACKVWCPASEKLCLSPVGDLAQTKLQLAQRDFGFLQRLGTGNRNGVHLNAVLHSCPNCQELNTLTLRQTLVPRPRFRSPHVTLADKLLISRSEADLFRRTAAGRKQLSKATHG
jgi:hypothetical protein